MFQHITEIDLQKTAIISDTGRSLSYGELLSLSDDLYLKINHRCLVFCLCTNTVESLVGYFSFVSNKVVPLMLDAGLDDFLLNHLIEIYQPEYIWLPSKGKTEIGNSKLIFERDNYKLIKKVQGMVYELNPALALLLTTSGSTGSPKLVRLSYENVLSNANSIAQYLSISSEDRPITTLPMHYAFGLSIINSHLLRGATILLTNRSVMETEFWQFLRNEKATSLSGVPYTYNILKKIRFTRMDLPHLKTLTQAGGRLSLELHKEYSEYCRATNKRFFVMYGQTEATARISYLPYDKSLNKLGSIGIAIPGGKLHLQNEQGELIENYGVAGELIYRGPNVSMGYAECINDLSKIDENQGVLFTGDIAKYDSDGYYYIVGRKKRFIKIFGNRINLDETETLVKTVVEDCACIGVDDLMVIYITNQQQEMEVKQFISAKTGLNPQAFQVRVCGSIPQNSAGKTLYTSLKI